MYRMTIKQFTSLKDIVAPFWERKKLNGDKNRTVSVDATEMESNKLYDYISSYTLTECAYVAGDYEYRTTGSSI